MANKKTWGSLASDVVRTDERINVPFTLAVRCSLFNKRDVVQLGDQAGPAVVIIDKQEVPGQNYTLYVVNAMASESPVHIDPKYLKKGVEVFLEYPLMPEELTFGQKLVDSTITATDPKVIRLKQLAAEMADIVHEHGSNTLVSGYLEEGAMTAIKHAAMSSVALVTNKH